MVNMKIVPKKGLQGLVENWQSDLIAAVSVSLVALPLALGIALAAGVPPMSGMLSAIIGGIVTTFFRGSHIAINGPGNVLVAVILVAVMALDDGSDQTLNYVFAAIVVSGALQVLLGLLKLGRFADIFHSSVIHGILAAIGIIIIAKQIHIAMGTTTSATSIVDTLVDAIRQIPNINPFVGIISLLGLLLLIFHSRISYKFFHFLPAPMWILVISIPFVYAFNFFEPHSLQFFGNEYQVGPELLIRIPDNLLEAIAHPNFSRIDSLAFWTSVLSITMITSIESLVSAKAVDKLDPYRRKTDLDKDLVGLGMSTMVSGALGGLPIVTVIIRSSVNVQNHAKTKWSNLYHGMLLLIFILFLAPLIQQVPLCALAILLVFTGFKLASPKVLKLAYSQGIEQLVFFVGTVLITLFSNLLIGIFGGLFLALCTHMLLARVSIPTFFRMIFNSGSNLIFKKNGVYDLKIKGIANFLATIKIDNLINQIPAGAKVNIDLSEARLVDFSILENLHDFERMQFSAGGSVKIMGLDKHISSANHKFSLKILTSTPHQVTNREIWLRAMADEHEWIFESEPSGGVDYFQTFYFFKTRPVEVQTNKISEKDGDIYWEISDISFEEGAFLASEKYNTTLGLIKLPFSIPKFTIEEKGFLDKVLNLADHKDIDYKIYHDFSNKFLVKVEDEKEVEDFLDENLKTFFEKSDIHHLESNGEAILIFDDNFKLAQIRDYSSITKFIEDLKRLIKKNMEDPGKHH